MLKDLKARRGYFLIHRLIDEGEHETQDFKFAIGDARKIARSLSAFANNRGGWLLIGVKDNGAVAGVRNDEDMYVVEQAAQLCCDPPQQVDFEAYRVEDGLIVIKAAIGAAARRPVRVVEADGRRRAYFRVADENIVAHPLMVRAWLMQADSADRPAAMFALDDAASALLRAVTQATEPVPVDTLPLALHMSVSATGDLIVRLAAMGLIDFAYNGHTFGLVPKDAKD